MTNINVQAAKDVQVQYQRDRDFGLRPRDVETPPEQVKNVAWPEPKGTKKQLIGTILGITAAAAVIVILSLLR